LCFVILIFGVIQLLFSKLLSKMWPSTKLVAQKCQRVSHAIDNDLDLGQFTTQGICAKKESTKGVPTKFQKGGRPQTAQVRFDKPQKKARPGTAQVRKSQPFGNKRVAPSNHSKESASQYN